MTRKISEKRKQDSREQTTIRLVNDAILRVWKEWLLMQHIERLEPVAPSLCVEHTEIHTSQDMNPICRVTFAI